VNSSTAGPAKDFFSFCNLQQKKMDPIYPKHFHTDKNGCIPFKNVLCPATILATGSNLQLSAAGHKHYTYSLHVLPMWILCHLYTNCYAVCMNIHVPAQASQQEYVLPMNLYRAGSLKKHPARQKNFPYSMSLEA
jgi:hypothetical protein